MNFSLNLFGDTLAMRTLLEVETNEVWPNAHGVKLLHSAAVRTTVADPFIKLPVQADRDFLHRAVKNALSELCPAAFVATALGHPVKTGKFLFAVTCERYPEMRTVKLRVLLVEEGTLRVGDTIVAGPAWGRVRAMFDERGDAVEEAGPSVPVQVLGLDDVHEALLVTLVAVVVAGEQVAVAEKDGVGNLSRRER